MTSWSVVFSISATRAGSKSAFSSISATASGGTLPKVDQARTAAISTASQARMRASSVQRAPISGRV